MLTPASQIALLGFGPQAAHVALALAPRGQALRALDAALAGDTQPAPQATAMRARIEGAGADVCTDLAAALRGVRLVLVEDETWLAPLPARLTAGQIVIDLASASADAHQAVAARITAAGVDCLAGQVSASPAAIGLAGPRAPGLAAALSALGLPATAHTTAQLFAARAAAPVPAPVLPAVRRAELP